MAKNKIEPEKPVEKPVFEGPKRITAITLGINSSWQNKDGNNSNGGTELVGAGFTRLSLINGKHASGNIGPLGVGVTGEGIRNITLVITGVIGSRSKSREEIITVEKDDGTTEEVKGVRFDSNAHLLGFAGAFARGTDMSGRVNLGSGMYGQAGRATQEGIAGGHATSINLVAFGGMYSKQGFGPKEDQERDAFYGVGGFAVHIDCQGGPVAARIGCVTLSGE